MSQCKAGQDNPLPSSAGGVVPDASDTDALLALLTHVQLSIDQDPQVSSYSIRLCLSLPRIYINQGYPIPGAESSTCPF